MALIRCENVSIGYEGQTVVKDLSFQIDAGDYLCIVGENGSGKSTTKPLHSIVTGCFNVYSLKIPAAMGARDVPLSATNRIRLYCFI